MPTLYVENVPAELYAALRKRAKQKRTSIAAETIALLREHVPTPGQLRRRREAVRGLLRLQREQVPAGASAPATEDLVRESRRQLENRVR